MVSCYPETNNKINMHLTGFQTVILEESLTFTVLMRRKPNKTNDIIILSKNDCIMKNNKYWYIANRNSVPVAIIENALS